MKRMAGLIILLAVIGIGAVITLKGRGTGGVNNSPVTLKGLVGGEKLNLLKDESVQRVLKSKYGITLDFSRRGSLEMVEEPASASTDFLWPSNEVALELYREQNRPLKGSDVIFNSPIVLYSWDSVTKALIKEGVVQQKSGSYYIVDMPKLIAMVNSGKKWSDIGLAQLHGKVTIYSTDPVRSNSGNMFAALLANVLNGGQVVTADTLPKVLPTVRKFFEAQGFMEQSSDIIFRQFLNLGMGAKPMIVGYEAQLLEESILNPADTKRQTEPIRMLYPMPTVWSSHPLIAVTDNGKRLIEALEDSEIQKLAWERHGFRPGSGGGQIVQAAFKDVTVPPTIDNVISLPTPRVVKSILAGVESR